MNRPVRLTAVLTHPIQYYAPWFRHIAAHCLEIDLTVLYATRPTPAQQGVGFGTEFEWDIPLTDGYRCSIVRPARPADSHRSDRFWGLHVPEVARAIGDSRPDVVLIPGWHSVTLLRALWACRRARIPVLYRGDTHFGNAPAGWRRPGWMLRTWLLLRLFDAHLAVGTRARDYLLRFGLSPSRVFDVPHCVDNAFFANSAAPHQTSGGRTAARQSFRLGAEDFVVLFAGKLEAKKRPLDLIRAMPPLGPDASLLMVGAGELESACRAEAERLGVRASWAGFLNQSELGRAYAAADCLVLPSDWSETWGLVVNEALATGLPCVVSDRVGCAPDLVTAGETGEIFPMGDASAMVDAVGRIRARLHAGHSSGPACRERAAMHSFDRATAGLLAACRAVTRGSARRGLAGGVPSSPRALACCGGMVIVSGLERMTFEVLRVLRERGAPVHCIVNSWENHRIVALAEEIGASWSTGHYRYPLERRIRNPMKLIRAAGGIGLTSLGLLRDARRFRPTHVLVPEFVSVLRNAPALALLRLLGVGVIFQMANAPEPGFFYRLVWRWGVSPFVDRFVCNSAFTVRELLAHGIPASKVSTIHNCAPRRAHTALARVVEDNGRIIYVGQIIPGKGLDLLLDAIGLLVDAGRDLRLDVVGDIDGWEAPAWRGYHARILARASRPDLSGRVRFLGWREDVPALLSGAAVHCCPSRPEIREGFGLVNIEAKEAGIPSVVLPSGALPELFEHGVDGWICSDTSALSLAEGLEYFLKDPARLERARGAARRSAERFSRERFAEAWWGLFSGTV